MKYIKYFAFIVLISIFSLSAFADQSNPLIYQYYNPDITVAFTTPLNVTPERQQEIADDLAGIGSNGFNIPGQASPDNIICTIFGHNTSTTTVTVTHHKVEQYTPRCVMEVYHVTTCSRCDYILEELTNSFHITCCPED